MIGPLSRLRLYTTTDQYLSVLGAWLTGRLDAGDVVKDLEREVARRVGARFAVAMPMARVGIYFAIKSLIRPGQKVILSPYTIADVVNMVICAGGVPVFADIERATCNIDPAEIERLIDGNTGAVLATHFYGLMADMRRIREICDAHRVPVVEDAAQAFGARQHGLAAGTIGTAGIYSFGMYKNVNSFFGGMVVTSDPARAEWLRGEMARLPAQQAGRFLQKVASAAITDLITWPPLFRTLIFRFFRWAFLADVNAINNRLKIDVNPAVKRQIPDEYLCRLTATQAQIILRQLDRVDGDARVRLAAAKQYRAGLQGLPGLILPPERKEFEHIYWYFPIQYADRHALVAHALRHGRDITMSYHRNCAELPCFAEWARDCPNARATANALIYLPTYPGYTQDEIQRTIAAIRSFFDAR
jgi:perosamine synthetase